MKIAQYVSDLMYEHECVVIPGLGGFIAKDHPAAIHPLKHQFKPPYREIVFNQHLRTNDGLLLSRIAKSEDLSYQEAKSNLDRFVLKCIDGLKRGHRIHFRNIGSIAFNQDQQIAFLPDENQNYLASSFGLNSFVSPTIQRNGFPERIENQVFGRNRKNKESEKPQKASSKKPIEQVYNAEKAAFRNERVEKSVRPNANRRQWAFVGALVVMMMVGWSYMNKQTVQKYYDTYAGFVPFFYSSPNDFLVKNNGVLPVSKILPGIKAMNSIDKPADETTNQVKNNLDPYTKPEEQTVEDKIDTIASSSFAFDLSQKEERIENQTEPSLSGERYTMNQADSETNLVENELETVTEKIEPQPVVKEPAIVGTVVAPEAGPQYLIIAGAFRERANADNRIIDLNARGQRAILSGQNKRGLWLVSIGTYDRIEAARTALEQLRKDEGADLWILKV